jgi:Galactokinase
MKNKLITILSSFIFSIQACAMDVSREPRFGTSIPFPDNSECSSEASSVIGDLAAQGYCVVGTGKYHYDHEVGRMSPGWFLVLFVVNSRTGDRFAYHTYLSDYDSTALEFDAVVKKRDGTEYNIGGDVKTEVPGKDEGDIFGSPRGKALLGGVATGIARGIELAGKAETNQENQRQQFSASYGKQTQIDAYVQKKRDKQALELSDYLKKALKPGSGAGKEGGKKGGNGDRDGKGSIEFDPTYEKNLTNDMLDAASDARWDEFVEIEGFLFENVKDLKIPENKNVDLKGVLKVAGPVRYVPKTFEGRMSLNGLIIASTQMRGLPNEWHVAQYNHHLRGVIAERKGDEVKAKVEFRTSIELSKVTGKIPLRAKLSFDSQGNLQLDPKADIKGVFLDPATKANLTKSTFQNFKLKDSVRLSLEDSQKLAARHEYAEQLRKMVPVVDWIFKQADMLLDVSNREIEAGDIQTALLAGDLAIAGLDITTNFTFLGAAGEAALNLLTGYNVRNGTLLTDTDIAISVLMLLPTRWIVSGKNLTVGALGKIVEKVNPAMTSKVLRVGQAVEKLAPYVPEALAKNREALEHAVGIIKENTPRGQNWIEKAERILEASKGLKDFNLSSLGSIIENRKLLSSLRDGYNQELSKICSLINEARSSGKDLEAIAREAHAIRRSIGEKYKNLTPENLRSDIYLRNFNLYGDSLGPSFEKKISILVDRGLSKEAALEKMIESSSRTNSQLNDALELINKELL